MKLKDKIGNIVEEIENTVEWIKQKEIINPDKF